MKLRKLLALTLASAMVLSIVGSGCCFLRSFLFRFVVCFRFRLFVPSALIFRDEKLALFVDAVRFFETSAAFLEHRLTALGTVVLHGNVPRQEIAGLAQMLAGVVRIAVFRGAL